MKPRRVITRLYNNTSRHKTSRHKTSRRFVFRRLDGEEFVEEGGHFDVLPFHVDLGFLLHVDVR